jgi:hypothetical protein
MRLSSFACGYSVFVQVIPINSCLYEEWVLILIGFTRRDHYTFTVVSYRGSHSPRPSYFLTSSHSTTFVAVLCCSKISCAWMASILKFVQLETNSSIKLLVRKYCQLGNIK